MKVIGEQLFPHETHERLSGVPWQVSGKFRALHMQERVKDKHGKPRGPACPEFLTNKSQMSVVRCEICSDWPLQASVLKCNQSVMLLAPTLGSPYHMEFESANATVILAISWVLSNQTLEKQRQVGRASQ